MDGEAELDRLIGLLYDSVLDETQWTAPCRRSPISPAEPALAR